MATFQLRDMSGALLTEKRNIGRLILWLKENGYFEKNPDTKLSVTELFTSKFEMIITANTTSQDIEEDWNMFNMQM